MLSEDSIIIINNARAAALAFPMYPTEYSVGAESVVSLEWGIERRPEKGESGHRLV